MKQYRSILAIVLVWGFMVFGVNGIVHAEEAAPVLTAPSGVPLSPAKDGFYLGLCIPYNTISSTDFDGHDLLIDESAEAMALVPKVDGAFGFGLFGGFRTRQFAVEADILCSKHDASWSNYGYYALSDDATLVVFDLNLKYFFNQQSQAQPFILGGINVCSLTAENYAAVHDNPEDAIYYGYGLNLGAGMAYYFTPQTALNGALIYRYTGYDRLEVDDDDGDLDETLNSGSLNVLVGLCYTF